MTTYGKPTPGPSFPRTGDFAIYDTQFIGFLDSNPEDGQILVIEDGSDGPFWADATSAIERYFDLGLSINGAMCLLLGSEYRDVLTEAGPERYYLQAFSMRSTDRDEKVHEMLPLCWTRVTPKEPLSNPLQRNHTMYNDPQRLLASLDNYESDEVLEGLREWAKTDQVLEDLITGFPAKLRQTAKEREKGVASMIGEDGEAFAKDILESSVNLDVIESESPVLSGVDSSSRESGRLEHEGGLSTGVPPIFSGLLSRIFG